MGTIEMTRDEVQRYKDAIFRDEIVERSPSPWVSREAYYTCCNILRERNRSGDPDKVTVQFRHGDREGHLYTLHYTVTPRPFIKLGTLDGYAKYWWFRIAGYGLHFRWTRDGYTPLFSERNGHEKVLKLGRLWIKVLRP